MLKESVHSSIIRSSIVVRRVFQGHFIHSATKDCLSCKVQQWKCFFAVVRHEMDVTVRLSSSWFDSIYSSLQRARKLLIQIRRVFCTHCAVGFRRCCLSLSVTNIESDVRLKTAQLTWLFVFLHGLVILKLMEYVETLLLSKRMSVQSYSLWNHALSTRHGSHPTQCTSVFRSRSSIYFYRMRTR